MYPKHKVYIFIVGIISLCTSYIYCFTFSSELAGNLLTTISIFFGFYVASASMVASSPLRELLHSTEDPRGDRCLSHTLSYYYEFGFSSSLVSILMLLLVIIFFSEKTVSFVLSPIENISMPRLVNALCFSQITISICFAFIKSSVFMTLFRNNFYSSKTHD